MMTDAGVTYDQVLGVLVDRGRYPDGTPLENIDPQFIDGWICVHWAKVLEMINAKTNGSAAA